MTAVYKEPTYQLRLSPLPVQNQRDANTPLDRLVDEVMQKRYGTELKSFSKSKVEKLRKQAAHSLVARRDQSSEFTIQLPLARAQGLVDHAKTRLEQAANGRSIPDLTRIAEYIFSGPETDFGFFLSCELTLLLRKNNKELSSALFNEACTIRRELKELMQSTSKFIRGPDKAVASSYDRNNPDLQNARLDLDNEKHVIYSTGRIETERKADQLLDRLIYQSFNSGQLKEENLIQENGAYIYPVVVENLINSTPFVKTERALLLQEENTLKKMDGTHRMITLPNGERIKIQLKMMHFSTQSNYNIFLGQKHGFSSTGSDTAEQITNDGTQALLDYFHKIPDMPDTTKAFLEYCFTKLTECKNLHERIILRATICELLNVPYHVHCKSSKDRTAIVVAIKKAIHQFLKVEAWKGPLVLSDPVQLFKSSVMKEYTEAALFETLPLTDQGVGFSGVLDGKLYTQSRGFSFGPSFLENPLPSFVMSDRHLNHVSLVERVVHATLMSIVSLTFCMLYVAFFPLVIGILYALYKEDFWEAGKYIFMALLLVPVRSSMRTKWMDTDSSVLKERSFFKTGSKPTTAPHIQEIYDQVEKLSSFEWNGFLQFIHTGEGLRDRALIKLIVENWNNLQKGGPSRIRSIIRAAKNSPVLLFQLLTSVSQDELTKILQETPILWPAENSANELIRKGIDDGVTYNLNLDLARFNYIIGNESFLVEDDIPHEQKLAAIRKVLHLNKNDLIPYEIQEALTQKTTLSPTITILATALQASQHILPPTSFKTTLILEEEDSSHCWLTIKEPFDIQDHNRKTLIHFDLTTRLKLSKDASGKWTTEFASITPVYATLDAQFDLLLKTCQPDPIKPAMEKLDFDTLHDNLLFDFEAASVWTKESLVPLNTLTEQMEKHLQLLMTRYSSQTRTSKKLLDKLTRSIREAKTPEGKAALDHCLKSFISKETKYRLFLIEMQKDLQKPLDTRFEALYHLIKAPLADARKQYQTFVKMLREALVESPNNEWLKALAFKRFAGIRMDEYCRGLVEEVSGPFDTKLTLDNFWDEYKKREKKIRSMPSRLRSSPFARIFQSLRANLAVRFDPLAKSNLPYVSSSLHLNGKEISILRHGVPISHHDPVGFFRRLLGLTSPLPAVTPDYKAFKDNPSKNILHIVLENGEEQLLDSESPRVQTRLNENGDKFWAVAFRMNGEFVDPSHYIPKTISETKEALKAQLTGAFKDTFYSLPSGADIDKAMNIVQDLYFSERAPDEKLEKKGYQSFIFLTYAELTLQLCKTFNIDIIEAGCRDDIDRGSAFKAILKLHYLRRKEELTPQKLEEVMVNLIAPALIVSKRAPVSSRSRFVRHIVKYIIPRVEGEVW